MKFKKAMAFIVVLAICLFAISLIAQETTQEGWRSFNRLTNVMDRAESQAQQLYNEFVVLKKLKIQIIDNAPLLAEVVKVIDVHPDYTTASIVNRINALEAMVKKLVESELVTGVQTLTDVDGLTVYVGYSIHFTKIDEAGWAIKRGIKPDEMSPAAGWVWANGEKELKFKWIDRGSLSY